MRILRSARFQGAIALLSVLLAFGGCRRSGGSEERLLIAAGASSMGLQSSLNDVALDAEGARQTGPSVSGGESMEGVYVIALTECLQAGRLVFQDQKIRLTRQEQFSNWAAMDGLFEDATPVRIKGETLGEMRARVLFTVGTRKSDRNKALVRSLKEGFEARLLIASPRDP